MTDAMAKAINGSRGRTRRATEKALTRVERAQSELQRALDDLTMVASDWPSISFERLNSVADTLRDSIDRVAKTTDTLAEVAFDLTGKVKA